MSYEETYLHKGHNKHLPSLFVCKTLIQIHRNLNDYVKHTNVPHYGTRNANELISLRCRIKTTQINKPNLDYKTRFSHIDIC